MSAAAHPAGTVTGPSPSTSGVQTGSTDDAGGSLLGTVALVSAGVVLAGSEATGSVEAAGSVVSTVPVVSSGAEAAGGSVAIGSDGALGSLVATGDVVAAVVGGGAAGVVDVGRDRLGRVDDGQRGGRDDEHRHPDRAGDQPAHMATNPAVLALHLCAPRSVVPSGGSATGYRGRQATVDRGRRMLTHRARRRRVLARRRPVAEHAMEGGERTRRVEGQTRDDVLLEHRDEFAGQG